MRRISLVVMSTTVLAALAACTTTPPPAPAPPAPPTLTSPAAPALTKLGSASEFVTAVNEGMRAKKTATVTAEAQAGEGITSTHVTGLLRFDGGDRVSTSTVTTTPEGRATVLMLAGENFMQSLNTAKQNPAKPWKRLAPPGKYGDMSSDLLLSKSLAEEVHPVLKIDWLRSSGTLEATAEESVDGVPTIRYTITVDMAKVLKSVATQNNLQLNAQLEHDISAGKTSVKHEVWVGQGTVPLRWRTTAPGPDKKPLSTTTTFQDWGKPVELTAPPADQTITEKR
ncbi:hypothetical protein [Allokutzneria sp. NRRL B-24872]|uniref:hypothetical protein n=1 Tax=Allokutzneria sp. NRRL B-24872 TaxID=1137961 RepID=UPI000A36C8C3|nr:hypothetical protein [Allokutzneria sp. NRRL B-24872]